MKSQPVVMKSSKNGINLVLDSKLPFDELLEEIKKKFIDSEKFFKDVIFKTIYSFHMPLFMLISGYLFYNSNQKEFRHLIISKLKII